MNRVLRQGRTNMRVKHDDGTGLWVLSMGQTSWVYRLFRGQLGCEYYGPKAGASRVFGEPPPNWPDHGTQIIRGRRCASVVLDGEISPVRWVAHSWSDGENSSFRLVLRSPDRPLEAEILIRSNTAGTALEQRTTLRHIGGPTTSSMFVTGATSFDLCVPPPQTVVTCSGWWVSEAQISRSSVGPPLMLESRSGKVGFENAPYIAYEGTSGTTVIEVGWSGNWVMHATTLWDGRVHVSGGLNPWGLRHHLVAGENLELPIVLIAHAEGDLNAATQELHRLRRARRIAPPREIPVHFNTWYPFPGEANVDQLRNMIPGAGRLGCESFVVDAGWYGTATLDQPAEWLHRAGDWVPHPDLYPKGLTELSDAVLDRGMSFGLWFEPEAAGSESLIRTNHPEWMHDVPEFRFRLDQLAVVNFGVPEAFETVLASVIKQLKATGATWMKWDFNANLWEGGWASELPNGLRQRDPLIAHYQGLYRFQERLLQAFPDLVLEMCASGGARFDHEIMRRAHTAWISDQGQPLQNLSIHFGSQLMHPPEECTDWLIAWPPVSWDPDPNRGDRQTDLRFRTQVAMLGSFGVSAPLLDWDDDDFDTVGAEIIRYKTSARDHLSHGNQYQLTDQPALDGSGDWAGMWFADPEGRGGTLSAFRLEGTPTREFALPGLDPSADYNVDDGTGQERISTGAQLESGLRVSVPNRFRSKAVTIQRKAGTGR